ncbi:MAG: ABC transporter substrate-binding protein [Chloroflexi bacterium]|nr:MAG: ABC transporter substrate-binding protein [Chloroflexota bacterium]
MNRGHDITRREVLRRGTALAAGLMVLPLLEACGQAAAPVSTATATPTPTPLPAPETTTFRIQCASCDAPVMAAERYLRDEGFTDVQITDTGGAAALTAGKLDMTIFFPPSIANAVQSGTKLVALGGIHPGCVEIWAPQSVPALTDLRGKTVVVRSKALSELGYSYLALVLKQAGVDPAAVNFVVQADADPVKLYLEGKNDAVFAATTATAALKANPANKGHVIHSQVMDEPWSKLDCCILAANAEWYRANPIAAKRALRAIYRSADALPADRADAAKIATDKGLFGGAANVALVREAANMVPVAWRMSDVEKSIGFFAPLLNDTGLSKLTAGEIANVVDLRIFKELKSELHN